MKDPISFKVYSLIEGYWAPWLSIIIPPPKALPQNIIPNIQALSFGMFIVRDLGMLDIEESDFDCSSHELRSILLASPKDVDPI